jgi:ubiquinone/menaquinone biosynthesis C-methylase UbiE
MATVEKTVPEIKEQTGVLVGLLAGYAGHRTVAMGVRTGLVAALADAGDRGATPARLAERLGFDPYYVAVWCRSAFAAQVCDRDGEVYRLAPHMAGLLLDEAAPTYLGGPFQVLEQPEMFGRFEEVLATGDRLWWDRCSPEFIHAVGGTGQPFYHRLVPGGLSQVPGLAPRLEAGCRILDTACGAGYGLRLLAEAYPACEIAGVDGDAYSLEVARETLCAGGFDGRVGLMHSPLESLTVDRPFTVVINNISMHECRDVDRVTEKVRAALEPGGWFVISDFPFPDDDSGLRGAPGRVMSAIQFFEAQIDDQLVPRSFYDELLRRHGFREIGSVSLTPMHALTYGRA